jgi:hypothetical protein
MSGACQQAGAVGVSRRFDNRGGRMRPASPSNGRRNRGQRPAMPSSSAMSAGQGADNRMRRSFYSGGK